jgi:hypothetical protein
VSANLGEYGGGWLVVAINAANPSQLQQFIVFARTRAACVQAVRKQIGNGVDLKCTTRVDVRHLARRSMKLGDICQIGGKRLVKLTLKKRQ